MKINSGDSIKPVSPMGVPDAASKPAPQGPAATATARGETVELSQESGQLRRLEEILKQVGVVDTAKVDAIKQAIVEGRFTVDSDAVADKLLASVREYLVAHKA